MTVAELFAHLHRLDVRLWMDGDRLRLNAPKGVLTPELSAELAAHKEELIAYLKRAHAQDVPEIPPIQPVPRDQEQPLSFAQQRLWFMEQMEPGNIAYNLSGAIRLQGTLDIQAFEQSIAEIVKRHEILRTTFVLADGQPVQKVAPAASLTLPVIDLSDLPKLEREAQAKQRLQTIARTALDLASAPPFQIALLRLNDAEHILMLKMHHIISDGVSVELFLRELGQFYAAFIRGEQPGLPDLPIQYGDYANWQRDWLQSTAMQGQLAYWKNQLAGDLPVLELPTDRPRPAIQTFHGAKITAFLPGDLTQAIKTLGRSEDATVFMVLLAAFKTLLHRYTGQTDIIVGSPIVGRHRPEIQNLIGCFINTLPFRTDLSGDPAFRTLLRRVREVALTGYANQDVPFEKLVEEIQPQRDVSRSPLFQAMILQLVPIRSMQLADLTCTLEMVDNGAAILDLTLNVQEVGDRLGIMLEYNTDLFDDATMRRFLEHFEGLLQGIVANPDQPISQLPLLPEKERQKILVEWNATDAAYPQDRCIHHLFEAQTARTPDAVAAEFEGQTLTYRQLNQRANQLAHYLQTQGIGPGTLIGIYVERSLEMLVGLLGILKVGAAYLPLDPSFPSERLAFMLADTAAPCLLTQHDLLDSVPASNATPICLDTDWDTISAAGQTENPTSTATTQDLAYVIYTSGSTGRPKGVQLRHQGVVNFLTSMQQRPGLTGDDTLLAVTTLSFDIAVLELFLPLITGAKVVIAAREVAADGSRLAQLLVDSQATVMQATPVTWRLLLEAGWPGDPRLKILCGGEALSRELADQLLDKCAALWNLYGPTETTVWSTVHQVTAGTGPISVGRPIANTQIYVLDSHRQPVPIGVPGDLYIGGDGLALGYLNRAELTAERFVPHPFSTAPGARVYKTGDLARYRPDGTLDFLGRSDHQVKLRGYRIELGEIETDLEAHPTVHQAVAVVREDVPGDKRLVAYVIPSGDTPPSHDELRAYLKEKLPDYMIPAAFVTLDQLPLTPNNKVDRKALPTLDFARPELASTFVPPQSEIEQTLAEIWKAVLRLDQVGIHDNFFDLGGHSLLLAQVHSKLKQTHGIDLPIVKLFQYPTIHLLADHLAGTTNGIASKRDLRRSAVTPTDSHEPIAIVGVAGRFPKARDIQEYWQNLCNGVECISFFSEEELRAAGTDPALLHDPSFVNARAILDDADFFDADFFGINRHEAEVTDPQHRLFLECAWSALENAGYDPEEYPGAIGVFAGASINTYLVANLLPNLNSLDTAGSYQLFLGNDKDFLPTRVSYKLNLRGPSLNIQTACSTSLVAVHQACRSLIHRECDMALAGGVSVTFPQKSGYRYQEGMILSPDGHCRAFDAAAKGTITGEGMGLVVLKRLSDALADGDQILAVIRGTAINNDGSLKVGYTAPSVEGQADVIAMAQAAAGVDPQTITYVEAHGTGTPLGDPIEIEALAQVFATNGSHDRFCAIGSVKTNIGHLDAAAGVAGVIKTALALYHKQIPPSLHFTQPNPDINFAASPFYVNTSLQPWQAADGMPRRAGVSSFGIGGTNAHAVLEEAPKVETTPSRRPVHLLVLSARTSNALENATTNLADHLEANPNLDLADVAYTLQVGRRAFDHRRIVACSSVEDAVEALRRRDPKRVHTNDGTPAAPPVVFMFPGQGAQYVQMGRDLYESEPVFRQEIDRCAELLQPHLGRDLRSILYPESDQADASTDQLRQTRLAQPAIFAVEYALARLWMSWGIMPQGLIGHSIGEYVAACIAGLFSLETALKLVAARGRLMQQLPGGEMLAVALPEHELNQYLQNGRVALAAVNAPSLCVVSGPTDAVQALQRELAAHQVESRLLHTSHAFHSPMMVPMLEPLAAELAGVDLAAPQIPLISNVTGQWLTADEAADRDYWLRHTLQPVRFADGLGTILAADSKPILLEVGPGNTLSQLARQHPAKPAAEAILSSLRHPREQTPDTHLVVTTLGRLWLSGVRVQWPMLYDGDRRQRVSLPTYPFERQRYWIDADPSRKPARQAQAHGKNLDIADWFYIPSWKREPSAKRSAQQALAGERLTWLVFVDRHSLGTQLVHQLETLGQAVIRVEEGKRYRQVDAARYQINPHDPECYHALIRALATSDNLPDRIAHLWHLSPTDKKPSALQWDEAAQARGFYSLLHLAQAIQSQEIDKPIDLHALTTGLHDIHGDEWLEPAKHTLLGLCRVIPQELPNLRCWNIDLLLPSQRSNTAAIAQQVVREMAAPSADPVVALRGPHRWVQCFEPMRLPSVEPNSLPLREQGVYLITGGLGEISFSLASYLARTVQARLALVGRTLLPPRAEWPAWLETHPADDSVSSRIRKVQVLEEMGAEVLIAAADVADPRQMQAAMEEIHARFGTIHGVIHAAGTVSMSTISGLDRAVCEQQFQSKGRGLVTLAKLLVDNPLDFCLVTSSLSSVLGGLGYAAYAAANAFMDGFVRWYNQNHNAHWTVVNWDGWMSAEAATTGAGHASGLAALAMTPTEGVETFARILAASPDRQVVVSTGALQPRLDQWIRLDPQPQADAQPDVPSIQPQHRTQGQIYVAPSNAQEEALAAIWREVLGTPEVSIHDNFFDLGGSSLVAVRLFDKIQRKFNQRLPLATLFDAPTVAELAALLEEIPESGSSQTRAEARWSPLVPIRSTGENPPLFLVHSAGGNILLYHDLARRLEANQPVYGLQAQGLDGKQPVLRRVEDMAALYVQAIQSIQPHGPYLLGGYCMGGSVAMEMAQLLKGQGEEIALLAVFETYNWRKMKIHAPLAASTFLFQKLLFHIGNFLQLDWTGKKNFLDGKLMALQERKYVWSGQFRSRMGWLGKQQPVSELIPAKVWETNDQAALDYIPRPYPGKITIFRPRKEYAIHTGPDLQLDSLAASAESYRIESYPAGMLVEPFVEQLAHRLQRCIQQGLVAYRSNGAGPQAPQSERNLSAAGNSLEPAHSTPEAS